jgi:lipopolysaccharide biosynthesis protein
MVGALSRALGLPGGVVFEAYYVLAQHRLSRSLSPSSKTAVCIHLYYTDKWALFARSLANLQDVPFDLFVTLPFRNRGFATTILAEFPDAHITVVPNRGRGTLPFIKIAQVLMKHRYEVVLKLHCKKSRPGQDGDSYLHVVLSRLLPESPRRICDAIERLSSSGAAILGASEVYLPLSVALPPNRHRLGVLIRYHFGRETARQVLDNPDGFGFFAGTMLWARLDAVAPLLRFHAFDFEPEFGQRDGSLPHVLERAFSLVPRLQGRQVLEVADGAIQPRVSESLNEPWW